MTTFNADVVATRGGETESRHRVHVAVMDANGKSVLSARDTSIKSFWRSCAKPFQVMPFVDSGGFDRLGWNNEHLAMACASHGGEPEHVALARAMLSSIDLDESSLACGPHEPLSERGARLLRESAAAPTRAHNNCSGKHSAMLARARTAGWPVSGYEQHEHPVQQTCYEEVAKWSDLPAAEITRAVDGCGCTVFGLSLTGMARAYANLASAAQRGDPTPSRIVTAMINHPFLVGGTNRFDTILMEETKGRVIAKVGAEGVHSVGVMESGLGIAVKVEDGAMRAQFPAVIRVLQELGVLSAELPKRLAEILVVPIRNTREELVGEIRPEPLLNERTLDVR